MTAPPPLRLGGQGSTRRWPRPAVAARSGGLTDALLLADAAIVLAVSGGLLWTLGINYDGLTGSAPQKLHPATYLTLLLVMWAALRSGNPLGYLASATQRSPASVVLAVVGVAFFLHIALRAAPGVAGALDTFLLPGLLALLLADCGPATISRLEAVVHAVMLANALLGLFEFASGERFFPYRFDGAVFETDTRSASLQGHPLGNATLTACYVLALFTGGGSLSPAARLAMAVLQGAALVVFGGRSAIVVTLVLGGGYGLVRMHRLLSAGRVPLLGAAAALVLVPLAPLALVVLAYGGFFDALLDRFTDDGGSANARVAMFDLFGQLPLRDVVLGPETELVESLRRIDGLEWGIENPVIRTLLYHGAVMTGLLTMAVTLFLFEVGGRCRRGVALPMLAFAVLINTFESLGGKTTLLAKFALLALALYRPAVPRRGPPRTLAGLRPSDAASLVPAVEPPDR